MASSVAADALADALRQRRYHMETCFFKFSENGKRLMKFQHLKDEIEQTIEDKVERSKLWEGALGDIINSTQEAAIVPPYVALAIRNQPGVWEYVKVHADNLSVDKITSTDYLKFKETVFDEKWSNDGNALEVDFGVFGASIC